LLRMGTLLSFGYNCVSLERERKVTMSDEWAPKTIDGEVFWPHGQWNGVWWCTEMCMARQHGNHEVSCHFIAKSREEIQRLIDEADRKRAEANEQRIKGKS
jgi:hypothetical protein